MNVSRLRYILVPVVPILVFLLALPLMTSAWLAYPVLILFGAVGPYLVMRSHRKRLSRMRGAWASNEQRIAGIRGYIKQYPLREERE